MSLGMWTQYLRVAHLENYRLFISKNQGSRQNTERRVGCKWAWGRILKELVPGLPRFSVSLDWSWLNHTCGSNIGMRNIGCFWRIRKGNKHGTAISFKDFCLFLKFSRIILIIGLENTGIIERNIGLTPDIYMDQLLTPAPGRLIISGLKRH